MPIFDYPIDQLRPYLPPRQEPPDFDAFWQQTLSETRSHPLDARFEAVDFGLKTVETYDVTFAGYGGQPIKGWFIVPKNHSNRLPGGVEYIGYGGGRSLPIRWLLWPSLGYAYLVMDTRGQGSGWEPGDTPDIQPDGSSVHAPGFLTLGILDPKTDYYRRLFADAVRAVETLRTHPAVDPERIAVTGGSQGGGITLAVSGLEPAIKVAMPDVPFLCHYRRAVELTDTYPYNEITEFCKIHNDKVAAVFNTLSYFDGVNFAARAHARAYFNVGLMDNICPPSTVFAAYNHYAGPKQIQVYEFNQHEGGGIFQDFGKSKFLAEAL